MDLTACIFGLSTLLSSYQIYNVQNRIGVSERWTSAEMYDVGFAVTLLHGGALPTMPHHEMKSPRDWLGDGLK